MPSLLFLIYSEVIRNETLRGQRHVVSKDCRQQVRAQLFQQRENINFDPKLKSVCQREIKQFCNDVPHGGGQVIPHNHSMPSTAKQAKNHLRCSFN